MFKIIEKINKSSKLTIITSLLIAGLFIKLFYPGLMAPDSYGIYSQAQMGSYGDHHPPMMAYLWHFFLKFHDGPALMFLLSMSMLWGSCMIMVFVIFKNKPWRLACLLIPFIPQVATYSGFIVKDNFFTFGYLLLSIWLAYKDIRGRKFGPIENIIFFVILFYATSVKYQAQFILPILLFWYASIEFSHFKLTSVRPFIKHSFIVILLCFGIINGIKGANSFLVTTHGVGSNNAWKYKSMYDLVGMAINSNKMLVPKFLMRNDNITLQDIQDHYELAWEPLVVQERSPLKIPDDKELVKLRSVWIKTILHYPLAYLKHRLHIWTQGLLLSAPEEGHLKKKYVFKPLMESKNFARLFSIFSFLINKFSWMICILYYAFVFPFQIYFLYHSFKNYMEKDNKYAKTAFFMNLMGLSLLLFLFFFSLAATARYVYLAHVMFFFSMPFFISMFKKELQN